MAIDSAAKRKSIASVALALGPVLVPDGAISGTERQAVGYSYLGIASAAPPAPLTPEQKRSVVSIPVPFAPSPQAKGGIDATSRRVIGYGYGRAVAAQAGGADAVFFGFEF